MDAPPVPAKPMLRRRWSGNSSTQPFWRSAFRPTVVPAGGCATMGTVSTSSWSLDGSTISGASAVPAETGVGPTASIATRNPVATQGRERRIDDLPRGGLFRCSRRDGGRGLFPEQPVDHPLGVERAQVRVVLPDADEEERFVDRVR